MTLVTVSFAACVGGHVAQATSTTPKATVPPRTTSTTSPLSGHWPMRIVTNNGTVQDVAPTRQALYWLVVTSPASAAPVKVTPTR
jgi:hypothetical protein